MSDGNITPYQSNSSSSSAPSGYSAITTVEMWNSNTDGSGSGLDADTLDGQQLSAIARLDYDNTGEVRATNFKTLNGGNSYFYTSSGNLRGYIMASESIPHLRIATSGNESIGFYDGGPSGTENIRITGGGDLELYQGHLQLDNNLELRSKDTGGTVRTITRINNSNQLEYGWSGSGPVKFMGGGSYTERMRIDTTGFIQINSHTNSWDGGLRMISQDGTDTFQMHPDNNGYMYVDKNWYFTGDIHVGSIGQKVWHQGNDGPSSGLSAQYLGGYELGAIDHAEAYKVWTGINADAAQAKRRVIARLYGCPGHWNSNWQNIEFTVTSEYYESAYMKYRLMGNYGSGSSGMLSLQVTEASGPFTSNFKLSLGSPVDAGWDSGGQDVFYQDLYADAMSYGQYKIHAKTYGHGYQTSNPTSGAGITVFYSSPAVSNISNFSDIHGSTYVKDNKIWNAGNDGSGSGLDADLLDGQQGSYYLDYNNFTNTPSSSSNKVDIGSGFVNDRVLTAANSDTAQGEANLTFNGSQLRVNGNLTLDRSVTSGISSYIDFEADNNQNIQIGLNEYDSELPQAGTALVINRIGSGSGDGHLVVHGEIFAAHGGTVTAGKKVWHTGNDGSGSGLDADTLDGVQASGFVVTGGTTQTVGTSLTFTGGSIFNNTVTANSHIYGRSVNNDYSHLYRFGGLFFTWDSDSYGTSGNHSIRSTYGDNFGDEITLNSYNHLRFNIDSNDNDSTSYFEVGHHTTGTGNILMRLTSPSGNLEVDGNVTAYSTSISDIKYKDNIEPLEGSLDKILQLQGVEFDWTATRRKGMRDIGFIAQEVEPIVPQVVSEHQNGIGEFSQNEETSKSIAYDKLVPLLVESIKEQQNQINELKTLINNLMEEK